MSTAPVRVAFFVVAFAVLASASATPGHPPTRYVLFRDCSPSVTVPQQARWTQQGHQQIARISVGDAVQIFYLHDNTASGEEAFARDAPTTDSFSARRILAQLRQEAEQKFVCPAGQHRGRDTDVLSAIDRVHPDGVRGTVVVMFSDMLNSMPEADIERRKVAADRMLAIIQATARRHRWTAETLRGVRVLCVLNSLGQGEPWPSPNDRRTIETFYRMLFEALGGRLDRFDTALPSEPAGTAGAR